MADDGGKPQVQISDSRASAVAAAQARARASSGGVKRILALDSCGLRAHVQIGLVARLEERLSERSFLKNFKLSDYFDLIAGTGIGAYFAAELARGRRAAEIEVSWAQIGKDLVTKRDPGGVETALAGLFGDARVQAAPWRTGFATFLKRRSDGAVLFVTDRDAPAPDALVSRVIAAATAAPGKLDSEKVALAAGGPEEPFVDAAAAGLGNPALELVRALAAQRGKYQWAIGPDRTLVVNLGAGVRPQSSGKWSVAEAMAQDVALAVVETLKGVSEGARRPLEAGPRIAHLPMLRYERFDAVLDADLAAAIQDDPVKAAEAARAAGVRGLDAAFAPPEGAPERLVFPKAFNPPGFGKRPLGPPKIRLEALGRAFSRRA